MTNKQIELPFLKQTAKKHSEEFPRLLANMSKSCIKRNRKMCEFACHCI